MRKTDSPLGVYLRIVVVGMLIAVLRLAPTPHAFDEFLLDANRSIAAGDLLNSATNLAAAATYNPWRYDLNIAAARYAFQAGETQLTIQYLERPGTLSRLATADLILLGEAYQKSGNPTMAEAIWKHISEQGNSIPALQSLADLYLQRKDYASAASYMQKLLSLNPSDVRLTYQIGLLYALTDPIKALPFLAQVAQMGSSDSSPAEDLHDKIKTASLFEEPAYTSLIVGRQLADWGDWGFALVAFQRAVSLRSDYADGWAFIGEARQQISLQETGSALKDGRLELELALQLDKNSVLANTLMGLYWERQVDYTQAAKYMRQAIVNSPQDPYLYSELGNILSKAGDLPAAQSAYEAAIKLTPQDPLFYRQLAQFAMDNHIQIHELALPAARQAILLAPHDERSLDLMAQVMLVLLDYHSAERYSINALQSDPQYAPAQLHLGMAYLYQGKANLARKWLTLAETLDPDSWVAAQATRLLDYYFPK